jgi:hypothetical protein
MSDLKIKRPTLLPLRSLTAMNFIPHSFACSTILLLAPNKHFSIVVRNDSMTGFPLRNGFVGMWSPSRIILISTLSYKPVAKRSKSVSLYVSVLNWEEPFIDNGGHVEKKESKVNLERR